MKMKYIRVNLKWGLLLVLMSFVLLSCKDDFDVEKLQDAARLVVYSFPTEGDTTFIAVTKSLPVSSFKGDKDTQSSSAIDANIIYKVNGTSFPVKRIEDIQEAKLICKTSNESYLSTLVGQYYAVGLQKAGDKIEVEVSADGFSSVSASTYIPEKVNVEIRKIRLKESSSDKERYSSVDKIEATFSDAASTTDYYSVKVNRKVTSGKTTYLELITASEPLLNKNSKINDDFGFDDYEFLDDAYIFSDRTINGQTYTLHLEVPYNSDYWWANASWDSLYGFTYCVDLYKVTPEYYRFLQSVNNTQNTWTDAGLMQITPTYSNVKGGYGVVAGYNAYEASKYIVPLPSSESK